MGRHSEMIGLSGRLGNVLPPVESADNRLARLHRPVCLPAVRRFPFLFLLLLVRRERDRTVMPVTEIYNKGLRTPTLHRLHRAWVSCGMVRLGSLATATLPTPKRPRARGPEQVDVSKKRGLVPATSAAARSGCHGGPSANRVAIVLPAFAAGREALGTLYRLYAAL
jgi:hypothetical protein